MNSDTATQPSPYSEFLEELHQQPLEDGPTIRLEVEPEKICEVSAWIERHQLPLIAQNSTWKLLWSGLEPYATDPVGGGTCRLLMAQYQAEYNSKTILTVLLLPVPHSAH